MQHPIRSRTRLRRAEWLSLALVLLALVLWLSPTPRLERLNHLVQDAGMRLQPIPASPDIVLIAIDDASIAAIGRWPWRRALHAELVRTLSQQQPRAIALDILFNESDLDYPADDALLAHAIADSGRVALPLIQRSHGPAGSVDLPLPALAQAAAALGHVHVALDTDGVVRSVYLQEGPTSAPWPHLSLALQCAAEHKRTRPCASAATQPHTSGTPGTLEPWTQQQRERIAYAAPTQAFRTYSYIDVLRGQLPAEALRDKYVLVGAVATGLGDLFATPVSPPSSLTPGVEVVAHILNAQLAGIHIRPAPEAFNAIFNAVPVAAALVATLLLGPLAALLWIAALLLATTALAVTAPLLWGMALAPAAAWVVLPLVYPLWSWRRLRAAARFLHTEMQLLQREGLALAPQDPAPGDFLDRRINAVEQATSQLRELHRFISDSLEQLPSATLVCDATGQIILANAAARHYGADIGMAPLLGHNAADVLHGLRGTSDQQPLLTPDKLRHAQMPAHSEGQDAQGRSLLLQCKPFARTATAAGWLLTLVDVSEIRAAQAQRDQALHFISHDIRAPAASIITLLEMQREYPDPLKTPELLARIERYAYTSLGMAESFVQLASAESQALRSAPIDLVALFHEAMDSAWAMAHQRQITLTLHPTPETAPCHGDRSLLLRALGNLLGNAVKYSPAGSTVDCQIQERAQHWVLCIRDQGPGIAAELQARLFKPFSRLHTTSHPGIAGVGLGLALAHTAARRHTGTLEVSSEEGQGAEFRLTLPKDPADLREPSEGL